MQKIKKPHPTYEQVCHLQSIVVPIKAAMPFYAAEEYHQDYYNLGHVFT